MGGGNFDLEGLARSLFAKLGIPLEPVGRSCEGSCNGVSVSYAESELSLMLGCPDASQGVHSEHVLFWLNGRYSHVGIISEKDGNFKNPECYGLSGTAAGFGFLRSFLEGARVSRKAVSAGSSFSHSQYVPLAHFGLFADYFVARFSELMQMQKVA